MTIELELLIAAILLGMAHMMSTGIATSKQHGLPYSMGPRDEQKPLEGKAGRLNRSFHNFQQSFPFFLAAVVIVQLVGVHNDRTQWGAQIYFWARLVYIPLYVFALSPWRSIVWGLSTAGIVLILCGLL